MSTLRPHFVRDFFVGIGYMVLIVALIALSILIYNKTFTSTVNVTLTADNVGTSLEKGADVEVRGVVVGTVTSISTNGQTASVGLALSPGQAANLPVNVKAQLLPKSLFGQRYVNLVIPASPSQQHLSNGDVIHPDTGADSAEIEDVFAHLLPVLKAVRPAKLAETLGAIAATLRNEGDNLGQTLETFRVYLTKFAPKVPRVLRDIRSFTKVARTYSGAAPDLVQALRNFSVTNQTIVQERAQFVSLLQSVTSSSNRLHDFVDSNSSDIITLSRSSLPTLRVVARYSSEFPCLSHALTDFIPVMDSALGKGTNEPGLHTTLQVLPARTPYVAGRDDPAYNASGGPSCPQVSAVTDSATAAGTTLSRSTGIGTDNSPQENAVIAEIMAASSGTTPQAFPKWGSLLLGPVLRGTTVSLK